MVKSFILILTLLISGCSTLQLANTATFVDYLQTRTIAKNPDKYYEHNPILGKHPSVTDVNRYFLGYFLVVNSIYWSTKNETFLKIWLGAETFNSLRNASIGIRLDF